jgi:tetratricopeptide (TPR) repeat protein
MSRWPIPLCLLAVGCVGFQTHVPQVAPAEAADSLALAADALDAGDERRAVLHFVAHLREHPDDAATRAQLAEMLFQQKRLAEARDEYAIFLATAQGLSGPVRKLLPHAHTRLMLIAQDENDSGAEQLHRGMGLFVLVESWDADPDRRDEASANGTLMKCVRALRAARVAHPARANLYLALAYERLGLLSAARTALRGAAAAAPFGLTPWERDRLAALAAQ